MKKYFKTLAIVLSGMLAFASCEDVPAPFALPGSEETDEVINEKVLPYNSPSCYADWTTEAANDRTNPWSQGNTYTKATGYINKVNYEAEGILVSPAINTTCASGSVTVAFKYILAYDNQDPAYKDHISLFVCNEDAEGNLNKAEKVELPLTLTPRTGSSWDVFNEEVIELPAKFVNCEKVHLVFWFYAPLAGSTTYEIKDFTICDTKDHQGGEGGDKGEGEGGDKGETSGSGTQSDPYSVAAAIAYINTLADGDKPADLVYTKGKISEVVKMGTSGSIQFRMSDDGQAANSLLVYYCDNLGKVPFKDLTDLKVGDEVIVCGTVQNYKGNTPEYNSGSYLVSLNGKTEGEGGDKGEGEGDGGDKGEGEQGTADLTLSMPELYASCTTGSVDATPVTQDGVTLTFAQNEGSNAPKYYWNATEEYKSVRLYAMNSVNITAGKAIASVKVICPAGSGSTVYNGNSTMTTTSGTISKASDNLSVTISGVNKNEVTITNTHSGTSGGTQLRIRSVEITYAK